MIRLLLEAGFGNSDAVEGGVGIGKLFGKMSLYFALPSCSRWSAFQKLKLCIQERVSKSSLTSCYDSIISKIQPIR